MTATQTRHRTAPVPRPTPRPFPVIPVAAALVVLLAVVAGIVSWAGAKDKPTVSVAQLGAVQVTGEALPTLNDATVDPAVSSASPVLSGRDFAGSPVVIGEPGTPQVVMFMAHWCPHCQVEVPRVTDWLSEAGAPEGVKLVGVSTAVSEDRPNYPPSAWLERENWTVPTLLDDEHSTAARAFGLSAFPYFVALDAGGHVVARASGELSVAELEDLVRAARGR